MSLPHNPWLPHRPEAQVRLFCFPHAGGGTALYHRWANEFPREIDVLPVLLPGRERRLHEPPGNDLRELAERIADALLPHLDRGYALFGHSMGALLAFELCRALRRRPAPAAARLFVAAYRAPQAPSRSAPLHRLPDHELIEAVQERFQGVPSEIAANPDLLAIFLPTLRADLAMAETYQYHPEPPLDCPLTALGGTEDRQVSLADLAAWRLQTTRSFAQKMLPGGHFFVAERAAETARLVRTQLERDLA